MSNQEDRFVERFGIALVGGVLALLFTAGAVYVIQQVQVFGMPTKSEAADQAGTAGTGCGVFTGGSIYLGTNRLRGPQSWNRWRTGLLVGYLVFGFCLFFVSSFIHDPYEGLRGRLSRPTPSHSISERKALAAGLASGLFCGTITSASLILFGKRQY